MPSATLDPGAPLDNTMGALLLGVVLSAVLYGISVLQTTLYFARYRRDPAYLKILVFATLVLDTIHMIAITHVVYYYLITNYYNKPALQIVVWSIAVEALPTGLTATLVQSFYAFRVYRISDKNVLLTVVILLLVGATSGCGIAWVVRALAEPHTYDRLRRLSPLAVSINALSTSVDVIITSVLCYMLHQSQTKSLADETFLNRLILITINTGLLTSVCAVASLITIVYSPNTLVYAAFYFCIGRLYSNALLASLNARSVIRGHIRDVDSNFHNRYYDGGARSRTRTTDLTTPADIIAATELAAQLDRDREAELYPDGFYGNKSAQPESLSDDRSLSVRDS
ncbi:hypothetical protein K438DRAFT_1973466 [Mycena galopus ATCC 62051]|nr:hypothetical protein K438DRAFT_1973466 [Mycena galopus ATCC 62051]